MLELHQHVKKSEYELFFIQINEAHSDRWPLGFTDHPPVQKDFDDRLTKACTFSEEFPYTIFVDTWSDQFEETYHAWPDKYYLIEQSSGKILNHSTYNDNAEVNNDYAEFLMGKLA